MTRVNLSGCDECLEDNTEAQRAAAEAVELSRSTLETTLCQGEQLDHCDDLRERHKYIVDKSSRLVRGMTWSGWVANAFSKDVAPPPAETSVKETLCLRNVSQALDNEEFVPEEIEEPATITKNYECNVLLLEQCQSKEEFDALLSICTQLNKSARKSLEKIRQGHNKNRLSGRSIQILRKLDFKLEEIESEQKKTVGRMGGSFQFQPMKVSQNDHSKERKLETSTGTNTADRIWSKTTDTKLQARIEEQDKHLDVMASSIQELLHNGASVGAALEQQNKMLESLNDGADELLEKSKMVTRRADRLSQRSVWRSLKSDFKCCVGIEHVQTKRFLAVEPQNKRRLILQDEFHPETCAFEVHERRGSCKLVGFQNKCTRTWLGQSALGYIVCKAGNFGRNEEWEIDDGNMSRTQLLCACSNYGNGGWLLVHDDTENFSVLGYDSKAKERATLWSIVVLDDDI